MAREMKDSGVEWIREIPKGWEIVKNKYLLKEIYSGGTPTSGNPNFYDENGIPFVSIGDMKLNNKIYETKRKLTIAGIKDKNLRILNEDTILYSIYATIGNVSQLGVKATISQALLALILNEEKYRKNFYKYNLIALKNFALSLSNGNTQNNLNAEIVKNFFLVLASLEEQEKIANYLDKKVADIDLIIEKTKATIEDYKKYKQSIITEAVTKGLNPDVEMKDSGIEWIGEIPKHWKIRKIKSFLSVISKGTTPKEISSNKSEKYNIKYIKSENIFNGLVVDIPKFYITSEINEELKRSQLQEDILFVIAGAGIGKTAIMPSSLLPANTNQAVSFLRLKEEYKDYKKYLWYFLQSNILKIYIELFSVLSAQPNLSMENLSNLKISLPEISEVEKIADYLDKKVSEIDNLIFKKESLINEMEEYKKSLIYECVTGKKEII